MKVVISLLHVELVQRKQIVCSRIYKWYRWDTDVGVSLGLIILWVGKNIPRVHSKDEIHSLEYEKGDR